jgi:hypothetical protein
LLLVMASSTGHAMPHASSPSPVDARLENLLEVERRLEARVRAAEEASAARVAAARTTAQQATDARRDALEAEAQEQERQDLEAHARELADAAHRSELAVQRLAAIPDAEVERLARAIYVQIIAGSGPP